MELKRTWILLLFSALTVACQSQSSEARMIDDTEPVVTTQMITHDEVVKIQADYLIVGTASDRKGDGASVPASFRPENLLPRLHPWFAKARNLGRATYIDRGWKVFVLNTIPDSVLADLDTVLMDDSAQRISFAILTKSFWHQVRQAQRRVSVSFLSFDNDMVVSGVYFHERKLVGLDIFSEPNTLPHELRHNDQSVRADERARARWTNWKSRLTDTCVSVASGAFGEVDATSFELANNFYRGIENEIPDEPNCAGNRSCAQAPLMAFPQISFFGVNMEYPVEALRRIVNETSCDKELREKAQTMIATQDALSLDLRRALDAVAGKVQAMAAAMKYREQKTCESQSSVSCDRALEAYSQNRAEIAETRLIFTKKMEQERDSRPQRLSAWAASLPWRIQSDLCSFAKGFEFIADCHAFLK